MKCNIVYELIKSFFSLLLIFYYFLKTFYISFSVLMLRIQILTAFGKHVCHSLPQLQTCTCSLLFSDVHMLTALIVTAKKLDCF